MKKKTNNDVTESVIVPRVGICRVRLPWMTPGIRFPKLSALFGETFRGSGA